MGRWVTINGAHVWLEEGQSPMDAFIRQKGGIHPQRKKMDEELELLEAYYQDAETEEERQKYKEKIDKLKDKMYEEDMKNWDKNLGNEIVSNVTSNIGQDNPNIRTFSDKIANQSKESAIVFDDNGKEIMFKDGEQYKVQFRGQELNQLKDMNFTHNHPTTHMYDTMFSKQDLIFMYDNDLKSMSAINKNGTIITLTRDKSIITDDQHKPGFLAGDFQRQKESLGRQAGGSLEKLDEAGEQMSNWLEQNAEKYGFRYKRQNR